MADRKTPMKDGELVAVFVAATTLIEAGHLVAVGADGYAVPAADAANLKVIGRAETRADNAAGQDGDISVMVRRKKLFLCKNDGVAAVAQAHVGTEVYVKDSVTVSSAGGTNNIKAGLCLGVDADGVWVER